MDKKEVKTFSIITLGDSGVGKTSIINRYINNKFDENNSSTVGINYSNKEMEFNNKDKIILRLMDTAGQEKYRAITKSYYRNANAVLFVFSLNDKDSFDKINEWMTYFKNNNSKGEHIPKYLVGTKNDLEKCVEDNSINIFAKENNLSFMSTSAKNNNNIDELFEEVGKNLYIDFIKKGNKGQININIKVLKKKRRNKCCFAEPDM